jgi:hypothetical protein
MNAQILSLEWDRHSCLFALSLEVFKCDAA